jgi:hypothetical protein
MSESDQQGPSCMTCYGTGEAVSSAGPSDCPDCGGSGILPSRGVLVEWRARDVERAHARGDDEAAVHVRWLLAELRNARRALNEIIALAHDVDDDDRIAQRIRFVANRALGTYEIVTEPRDATKRTEAAATTR